MILRALLRLIYVFSDPGERIFIYHYDASNNSWSQHQQFHIQDPTSLEFILVERDDVSLFDPPEVYLSVTGDKKNPGITVYEWDFDIETVTITLFLRDCKSITLSTFS